jgi:hypothetical protein
MNGNIFNHSLASEEYSWKCNCGLLGCSTCRAYAIPPNPPTSTNTITGEPIFVKSYINAYNTAFNQSNRNYQKALNNYLPFTSDSINNNFIPGTFGYDEGYSSISNSQSNIIVHQLQNELNVYYGQPYLFMSTGSGGGSGFMYLDWIIVTYGVPYVIGIS